MNCAVSDPEGTPRVVGPLRSRVRFARWHYRRDPAHVVFYRESTLRYLAEQGCWVCQVPCKNVVLMRKPAPAKHMA